MQDVSLVLLLWVEQELAWLLPLRLFFMGREDTNAYRGGAGATTGTCNDGRRHAQAVHRSLPPSFIIVQRVQLHESVGAAVVLRLTSRETEATPADALASRTSGASRRARCVDIVARQTGHSFFALSALQMHCRQNVWPHGVTNGHTSWSQQIGQRSASLERFAFVRVISLVCESRRRRGASARLSRFLLSRGVISVTTSPLSPTAGVGTACINTALAPGIRLHNCAGAAAAMVHQ